MEDDDDFGDLYENVGAQDRSEADEDELEYDDREYASLPVNGLDDDEEFEEEEMLYGTPIPPPVVKAATIPPSSVPSEMSTKPTAAGTKIINKPSEPAEEDDEGEDEIYAQLYGGGPSTATADASPPLPSRTPEASSFFGTRTESSPDLFWPTKAAGAVRTQELPSLPNNAGKLIAGGLQNETASVGKPHGSNKHSTVGTVVIYGSRGRESKDGTVAHRIGDIYSGSSTGPIESGQTYQSYLQGGIGRNIPAEDVRDGSEGAVTGQTQEAYKNVVADEELRKDAGGEVDGSFKVEFQKKNPTPEMEQLKAIVSSSMDTHTGTDLVLDEGNRRAVDVVAPLLGEIADGHTETASNSEAMLGTVENVGGIMDTAFLFPSRDVRVPGSANEAIVSEFDQNKGKEVENGVLDSAEKLELTDTLDTGDMPLAEEDRDESQDFVRIVDSDKGGHGGIIEAGDGGNAEGGEGIGATDDMTFAVEEEDGDWNRKWDANNVLPNNEGDAVDDFEDSGSEDDLEIVLNEEPHFPYIGRTLPHQAIQQQHLHASVQSLPDRTKEGGLHEDDDVDDDSDDDDELVILGNEPMAPGEEAWSRAQPLGETGDGGAPVGISVEGEPGIAGQGGAEQNPGPQRASGAPGLTPLGPRSNLSGVRTPGQHGPSLHMKYVRPGVAADGTSAAGAVPGGTPNGIASGAPGEATQGAIGARGGQPAGAGRGEWGWNSVQQRYAWAEPVREFMLPSNKSLFDVNIEELDDKPWRRPGADLSDYFNCNLNESSWQEYCRQLAQLKEEAAGSKIRVYESNREQEYDPELPPELAAASGNPERGGPSGDGSGRGRGGQLPGRAIQVDGGFGGERRPSHELRRHRPYDPDVVIEIKLLDLDEFGNPLPEQPSDVGEDKNAVKEKQELEAVQEQAAAMAEDTGELRPKDFSQREDMQYSHVMQPRQLTPHRGMGRPTWPGGEEGPPNGMWERMNVPLMTGPGLRRGGPMRGNAPLGPGPGLGMGPMSGMGPGSMGLPSASMGPGPPLAQMGPLYPPPMSMANRMPGPGGFGVRPLSSGPRPPMRPSMGLEDALSPFGSPPEYHGGRAVEGMRQMSPPPPPLPSRRLPPPAVRLSKRGGISDDETNPLEAPAAKRSAQESEEESEDEEDEEDEDDEDDDDDDEEEEIERDRARRDMVQRRHLMKERQEEVLRSKAWELSPPQSHSDDSRSRRRGGGEWIQEENNNITMDGKDRRKPEERASSRSAQIDLSARRTSVREEESSRSRRMPERSSRDDERSVPLREREVTRGGRGWSDPEWKEMGRSSQLNAVSAVHGGRGAMRGERGQNVEAERRQDRNSWEEPMNVLRSEPRKVMERQGRREDGTREKKRGHERDEEAMVRMDRSIRHTADSRTDGRPVSERSQVEGGRGSRGETRAPTRKRVVEEGRWEDDRPREQWRVEGSTRPLESSERTRRVEKDKKRDTVHDRLGARQADFPDDRNVERSRHWDRERERERPGDRERSKTRDSRTSEWEQTRSKKRRGDDWARDVEPVRSHRSDEHTDRGDLRGQLASGDDRPRKEKRGNEDGTEDYERGNGGGSNLISGQRQSNGVSGSKRRTATEEVAGVDPSGKTKRRRSDDHGELDSNSHATDRKDDHDSNPNGRRTKERSGARETVVGEQEELRSSDVAPVTGRVGRSRYERWKSVKIVEEKDLENHATSTVITDISRTEIQEHAVEQEGDDGGHFQKDLERGPEEADKGISSKFSERQKSAENAHVKEDAPLEREAQLVHQSGKAEKMHKREVLETREYESAQKGEREVRHSSSSKDAKTGSGRNRDENKSQDMHSHQVSRGKKERAGGGGMLDESEEIRKRRRERFGPIDESVGAKETPALPHGEEIKADRPPRKRRWA